MPFRLPPAAKLWFPIAALAGVAVIFNAWFLNFSVRTAGDWGYFVQAASDTLRRHYFAMWLSDTQFGRVLIDAGQAPSYAAYGWLSYYLHTGYALNERLVHLWPAVLVAVFSSYALVRYIFRDRLTAVLGTLVYAANTYYLALLTGGLTLAVAYALAPLVLLCYMKAINSRSAVHVLTCALTLAVCGAYEPRVAYIVVLVLVLLAAVHFFFVWRPKNRLFSARMLRTITIYVSPLVLFGLLNAYWMLGLAKAGGVGGQGLSVSLFGNEFFTVSEALTLFHPYWTGGQIQPFFIHPIPLYFWLVPIAAVAGLAVSKRTPVVLFFALLGVLGVLLTKQSDEPFAGLYHWLFVNVPGFNAFREASKFYLLTALAYAVLLPGLYWYVKTHFQRRWLTALCFTALALLFLPNLLPIATNTIGGTFRPRSMPAQYVRLNKFLDTSGYGRVLWVPQKSRWSFYSANHPAVSADDLVNASWKPLADSYASNNNATPTDEINALLSQNYLPSLLADAGITYVVVPMRDVANEDNFYRNYNDDPAMFADTLSASGYLKEAPVRIDGFKVYQTAQAAKPYISARDQLFGVADGRALPAAYSFWQQSLAPNGAFTFALGNQGRDYTTGITDLFGGLDGTGLRGGTLPVASLPGHNSQTYYFDQAYKEFSYTAGPAALSLQPTNLPVPGAAPSQKGAPVTVPLVASTDYIISTGTTIEPVVRSGMPVYLGSPRSDTGVYAVTSGNLVPAPQIEHSLWQQTADNCDPYGTGDPNVRMASSEDSDLARPVLSLMADDHAACSGPPPVGVQAGESYLLHLQYRGFNSQFAGYRLTYNGPHGRAITTDIPLADNVWHTYESIITVPAGTSTLRVQFIGRPSNQLKDNTITSYTGLSLKHLHKVATIPTATGVVQKAAAATPHLAAGYQGFPYHNLVPDASFENGLWKKQVGDCDAYDNNAALRMSLAGHQDGGGTHALQLEAKRHIACTNTPRLPVQGGATYLFQFDYQSSNAASASYVITLDDKAATKLSRLVPITDSGWHTFSQTITLPPDAHNLSLAVLAYSSADQSTYLVNRYDNFVLQRVPDVQNRFYAVSSPTLALAKPRSLDYQTVSSTYHTVSVRGAGKPFVLVMAEQYHPGWQLVPGAAAAVRSHQYLPWKPEAALPASRHIEANGFENAWLIQPEQFCRSYAVTCTQNADGTWDMRFGLEFAPQRWFNFGLLVSGTTALACGGALAYLLFRRRAARPISNPRKEHTHAAQHSR